MKQLKLPNMRKEIYILIIFLVPFLFANCSKKKTVEYYNNIIKENDENISEKNIKDYVNDTTNDINDARNYYEYSPRSLTFDSEEHRILERRISKCDARLLPYINVDFANKQERVGYQLEFFNYGGLLRIDEDFTNNIFLKSANLGYKFEFLAIDRTQSGFNWESENTDGLYGSFGVATISTPILTNNGSKRVTINNVLITPLAYRLINRPSEKDEEGLLLVHLIGNMNKNDLNKWIVFACGGTEWLIAHDVPSSIITN